VQDVVQEFDKVKIEETSLAGVLLIEPDWFPDGRGFFMETYNERRYGEQGLSRTFVQDNHSRSVKGVVRGLHYQLEYPQGKFVYVVSGEIFDVAVDIRQGSATFGQWVGVRLSDENKRQLFIPEGFAHGFCVLSEAADVIYKCTEVYHHGDDYGILWSDEQIGINWSVENAILSGKDAQLPALANVPLEHFPHYRT
jgi:dTDP-4-dehydrorhamnose 3,5-epimerase